MQPQGGGLPAIGLAIAGLSAFGVASVTITIRQIGRTESTQPTVLWFTGLSMLAVGALMPFFAEAHTLKVWAILLALGSFGRSEEPPSELTSPMRLSYSVFCLN